MRFGVGVDDMPLFHKKFPKKSWPEVLHVMELVDNTPAEESNVVTEHFVKCMRFAEMQGHVLP